MFSFPKLGKLAKRIDHRTLKLASYGLDAVAAPPAVCNLTGKITHLGMMLNDSIGDCTCAGAAHMVQAWTAEATTQVVIPDASVLHAYEVVGGYKPNNPSTDNGAECLVVLNYWRKTGIGGHKIAAYAEINPAVQAQVQKAVYYFGGAYCGFALPLSVQGADSWEATGGVNAVAGSWGGHCVPIVAYDAQGVWVITWGKLLKASWQFVHTYCDEAYAVLSRDIFEKTGKSPEGFLLAKLQQELTLVSH